MYIICLRYDLCSDLVSSSWIGTLSFFFKIYTAKVAKGRGEFHVFFVVSVRWETPSDGEKAAPEAAPCIAAFPVKRPTGNDILGVPVLWLCVSINGPGK